MKHPSPAEGDGDIGNADVAGLAVADDEARECGRSLAVDLKLIAEPLRGGPLILVVVQEALD